MKKIILFKALIVGALTLFIGIPLMMIQSTISERMTFRADAVRSIAADSVAEQSIMGPVLVIPYTDTFDEEVQVDEKSPKTRRVKRVHDKRLFVFPNDLEIKGSIDTDSRYRGIHKVLVYSGQHAVSGDFVLPKRELAKPERENSVIAFGQPFIALSIDDVRGIRNIPLLTWGAQKIEFQQGSGLISFKSGLHAPLPAMELKESVSVRFSFDLGLDGMERIHFSPVARNNQITLKSEWPHPQFGGRFLPSPKARTITEKGFSATWNISALASGAQQQLMQLENNPSATCASHCSIDFFSVGFIEPVNIYSQADRAVKYGLLFVALTFAAFFLFEILKHLPVHPVQYLLVGLAMVLFFLLLVSLSEHIKFLQAYLISTAACILLIGFYLSYVLRDWRRGLGFGVALSLLYGVLFGLLQSENNALVMGSILLFGVLSAIMIVTRKVDWYQLGSADAASPA